MKEENTERRKEVIQKKIFNLQERFIEYAANIIKLTENIPDTKAFKQQKRISNSEALHLDIGYSLLDIGYSKEGRTFF